MRETLHIHLFFIPAQVDICCNARETPPVCFQNEPMYLRKRKKERLLLCQQVQVAKNTIARWSNGIYEKPKWHFCLPFRSGKHIFTGRSNARTLREPLHGARMASALRKSVFLHSSLYQKTLNSADKSSECWTVHFNLQKTECGWIKMILKVFSSLYSPSHARASEK